MSGLACTGHLVSRAWRWPGQRNIPEKTTCPRTIFLPLCGLSSDSCEGESDLEAIIERIAKDQLGALGLVVNPLILWTTGTGKESWRRPLNLSKAKALGDTYQGARGTSLFGSAGAKKS